MAGVGDRAEARPIMRGREWRAFGRLGTLKRRKTMPRRRRRKRRREDVIESRPSGTGGFESYGRSGRYGSSAAPTGGQPKPQKAVEAPRYVSSADIAGFNTTEKIHHEMLRKRVVRIKQAGMGVKDPKTGKATRGAVWERW